AVMQPVQQRETGPPPSPLVRSPLRTLAKLGPLLTILAVAAFLRPFRLDELPLGFHYDEGLDAISALEIWSKGIHPIFFPSSGSREPLMIYLDSFGILALGATRLGARIMQALVGTGTVLAVWFLFKELFRRRNAARAERSEASGASEWNVGALLATAFMAVSFWHMFESRLGLRAISQPLVQTLCLLFFWRALVYRRWRDALLSGVFLGLAMYTYTAARVLPLLFLVVVVWQAATTQQFARRQWSRMLALAGTGLLVFLPLGIYAITNVDAFFGRSLQVNVLNPQPFTGSDQAGGVVTAVARTLGMFSIQGDPAWKYNLGGQPVFDWPVAALFYAGVLLAVARVIAYLGEKQAARPTASPEAFLLLWMAVMLVPGFLSSEAPHFLRTLGIIPAVFAFPALTLDWLSGLPRRTWAPRAGLGLLTLVLLGEGGAAYYRYFVLWAHDPAAYYGMQADAADVAAYLAQLPQPEPALFSSEYPGHPTLLYLAPKEFGSIRWFNGRESLAIPPAGRSMLYVFTAGYRPGFADLSTLFRPDQLVHEGRDPTGKVAYSIYRSDSLPAPAPATAVAANIGGLAQLTGYTAASSVTAGETLDVQELWRAVTPGSPDIRAFLHLVDSQGHLWSQADGLGFYAEDWEPGDVAVNDQKLVIPAQAPPISMSLQFGLYNARTGQQLAVRDATGKDVGTQLALGSVEVRPGQAPAPGWQPPHPMEQTLEPGLALIGYSLPNSAVKSGQALPVSLFWKVTSPLVTAPDVRITGADGSILSSADTGLHDVLPVARWPVGIVEDRHDITVAPTAPKGRATVAVGQVQLGQIDVTEPPRDFQLPPVQTELQLLVGDGSSPLEPGRSLLVTLVWQSTSVTNTSYKVFVHVLDPASHVVAQRDDLPLGGSAPTTSWVPGQVVADRYEIGLPATLPAGVQLEVGMYEPQSGRRVPIGSSDRVLLPLG